MALTDHRKETAGNGQFCEVLIDNHPPHLVVTVVRAIVRNPKERRPDPYVQVLVGAQKQRTPTQKNTNTPYWNHNMRFLADGSDIMEVRVIDDDVGRNDLLFSGRLSISSLPQGRSMHYIPTQASPSGMMVMQQAPQGAVARKAGTYIPGYVAEQEYGVATGYTDATGITPILTNMSYPGGRNPFARGDGFGGLGSHGGFSRPIGPTIHPTEVLSRAWGPGQQGPGGFYR